MSDFTAMAIFYVVLAMIAAIPLMFIVRVLYTYFIAMFQKKKKLRIAKEQGHVVNAWCTNRREPVGTPEPTDRYFATYTFEYNGKTYKRHFKFLSSPPSEMTLYFYKKPSKAEPEYSFIGMETSLLPFYVCSFVIALIAIVVAM